MGRSLFVRGILDSLIPNVFSLPTPSAGKKAKDEIQYGNNPQGENGKDDDEDAK